MEALPNNSGVTDQLTRARRYMPTDIATYAVTAGFTIDSTGGGCLALYRQTSGNILDDGEWFWLTCEEGGDVPRSWGACLLGRYTKDGDPIEQRAFDSVHEAIDAALHNGTL